jgi:hypothetical protein
MAVAEEFGLSASCQGAITLWGGLNRRRPVWQCYFKPEVIHNCELILRYGEDKTDAWEEYMGSLYAPPSKARHREEAEQIRDWMAGQGLIEETHPIGFT